MFVINVISYKPWKI